MRVRKIIKKFLIIVITFYIFMTVGLYLFQTKLIFFPQKLTSIVKGVDDIELKVEDGIYVRGYLGNMKAGEKNKLIICFEGNASEISYLNDYVKRVDGYAYVLINYRGYGLSDGEPTEKNLFHDAEKIYDHFYNREDIDKDNIVLMGRSLGTGVATYLSSIRKAKAVILVSPYDSVENVAKERFVGFPIEFILNNKFESIKYAKNIDTPMLCLYTEGDNEITSAHTKKLYESWKGKKVIKEITTAKGHNDMMTNEDTWKNVNEYFKEKNNDL